MENNIEARNIKLNLSDLINLYHQCSSIKKEIENLQNREYSKKVFNQNFEILRGLDKEISSTDGRNRYYAKERFCGKFYLTSQWVDYHWEPFLNWLNKMNKK